ncbi:MAG: hypothetical protein Q8P95_03695, partial [bacterium]|nr:hypothetical protein [bacterium]
TRDVKGLYGHVDHLYKHVDGLYAHTEDLARDVKGLYGHTEELSHQYGVRRVEHSHLHSWVSSLAEDMTIVKRKLSL